MSILPKYGLIQYRNSVRIYNKTVEESLQSFKDEGDYNKVTIFLFHTPGQLEELDSAINFLNNFGVLIYVDWLDEEIPTDTNGTIAKHAKQVIKEKIKTNSKFIFLGTEEAITSHWCSWVLGHVHPQKPMEDIAILPIRADFTDYGGAEYLEKFPYIHEIESEIYGVRYPNGDAIELAKWMES